jgi:hypothetical protein
VQQWFDLELDFRLVVQPGYLAGALPKLNVMAIDKLLCLFHGLAIIGAFQWNGVEKMAI